MTSPTEKTIQIYLPTGEPRGIRIADHNKKKPFWKTAVFCISKTQNFTQTHIRWLEWHCMQTAKEVARYTLDNGQVPDNSTYVLGNPWLMCVGPQRTLHEPFSKTEANEMAQPNLNAEAAYENAHLVAQGWSNACANVCSTCPHRATTNTRSAGATSATSTGQ